MIKWEACEDAQNLKETFTYQHAEYNSESVKELEERFYKILRERILNEQMVSHYYQRYSQLQFELDLFRKLQWMKAQSPQLSKLSQRYMLQHSFDGNNHDEDEDDGFDTEDIRFEAHRKDFHELITALFSYFRRQQSHNLSKNVQTQFRQSLFLLVSFSCID